jgi:hypothetical protein
MDARIKSEHVASGVGCVPHHQYAEMATNVCPQLKIECLRKTHVIAQHFAPDAFLVYIYTNKR